MVVSVPWTANATLAYLESGNAGILRFQRPGRRDRKLLPRLALSTQVRITPGKNAPAFCDPRVRSAPDSWRHADFSNGLDDLIAEFEDALAS